MAKLLWSPEAVDELECIPLRLAQQIYDTAAVIASMPAMGRVREELRGLRAFPVGYYFIIYDVLADGEAVYITALQDCRRGDRII